VPDTPIAVRAAAATDVGRVRAHNEDSHLVTGSVFAVADGMGGHAAGEVASRLAVEALADVAERPSLSVSDVVDALAEANERMLRSVTEHQQRRGMGTTVSGLALVREEGAARWAVFNLGDSRVYRYAAGRLTQLTVDHSEVWELVEAGLITRAEAARHPLRNVVTRSLGLPVMAPVDVWTRKPEAGERFLVCSDGLTGELGDEELARLLAEHDDPQDAADALVRAAVEAGGRDNVTVIVVVVDSDQSST
jgi:protein phosphatase